MKKVLAVLLAAIMLCASMPCCVAEQAASQEEGGLFDRLGDFFSDAWEDVSSWAQEAWNDVSGWAESAWGDASEWVMRAWDESSAWVVEIWGEASAWATESYEAVSAWMTDTFNNVTDSARSAWQWLKEETANLSARGSEALQKIREALSETDEDEADAEVKASFYELLGMMDIIGEDADKVWQTVQAYAKEKGIPTLTAAKLALPYLFQLAISQDASVTGKIPPVMIAQYLTGVFEKEGVTSGEDAEALLQQLQQVLNAET